MKNNRAGIIAAALFSFFMLSCHLQGEYGKWEIKTAKGQPIPWAAFNWTSDSQGNRFFERSAMMIPAKVEGLPYTFLFQFDMGSNLTMLYGENVKVLQARYPAVNFKSPVIRFGAFSAVTQNCYIQHNYGDSLALTGTDSTGFLPLGTIGADMFQNKVLIIDYPNERFAICDSVPAGFDVAMTDITLDKYGRAILPMVLKNKRYRVLFDNGSSLFQLIASAKNIARFSQEKDADTIRISSWGKKHDVTARPLKDSFMLAGQHFYNIMVYADHRDDAGDASFDAITGNALFWDKTVIIDFKNKKFGVN